MRTTRAFRHPDIRRARAHVLAWVLVGVHLATSAVASAQPSPMEVYLRALVAKERRAAIDAELDALDADARKDIVKKLGTGWEVSAIPTGTIESAGAFIDRMRGD